MTAKTVVFHAEKRKRSGTNYTSWTLFYCIMPEGKTGTAKTDYSCHVQNLCEVLDLDRKAVEFIEI